MQLSRLFFVLALALAPVALVGTTWLYLYPLFDVACAFPAPSPSTLAPFRLLALGDPQLEGDTSLPRAGASIFASFDNLADDVRNASGLPAKLSRVGRAVQGIPHDVRRALEGYVRKPLDIWGNDWYLAHVVRTLRWWTAPSHVAVLGDLLGSQWVRDEEFGRRSARFWGVVMRGLERVPERIMTGYEEDGEDAVEEAEKEVEGEVEGEQQKDTEGEDGIEGGEQEEVEEKERQKRWGGTVEVLGSDSRWANRAINIAGNHDIGYAGDIDVHRIARFERTYGKVNWDIVFTLPNATTPDADADTDTDTKTVPALRLVILNTMNLDTPALAPDLQRETYDFINHIVATSRSVTDKTHATVLLTHIPLYKPPGVCVDSPFFSFFDGGGVKEQNMLSEHASKIVLESLFGLNGNPDAEGKGFGRRGVVVNGHDHAGCDVLHWTTQKGVDACVSEDAKAASDTADVDANENASIQADSEFQIAANDTTDAVASESSDTSPSSPPEPEPGWHAARLTPSTYTSPKTPPNISCARQNLPHMRELTLRSMMGEFGGHASFLSAWFDPARGDAGEWIVEASTCGLGVQHWWWAIHIVDAIFLGAVCLGVLTTVMMRSGSAGSGIRVQQKAGKEEMKKRDVVVGVDMDNDGIVDGAVGEKGNVVK